MPNKYLLHTESYSLWRYVNSKRTHAIIISIQACEWARHKENKRCKKKITRKKQKPHCCTERYILKYSSSAGHLVSGETVLISISMIQMFDRLTRLRYTGIRAVCRYTWYSKNRLPPSPSIAQCRTTHETNKNGFFFFYFSFQSIGIFIFIFAHVDASFLMLLLLPKPTQIGWPGQNAVQQGKESHVLLSRLQLHSNLYMEKW